MARTRTSQAALAQWCGVHQSTISRVLRGEVPPSAKVISGAMDLFGIDRPGELFDFMQSPR